MTRSPAILLLIVAPIALLGCRRQGHELDPLAAELACGMNREAVTALSGKHAADVTWPRADDPVAYLEKGDDVISLTFDDSGGLTWVVRPVFNRVLGFRASVAEMRTLLDCRSAEGEPPG